MGNNDPETLGTLKKARKTDLCLTVYKACLWLWKYPWLLGRSSAISAAILILSSNMCRKFTASFHLVTKEHSAPGFPLPPSAALSHLSPSLFRRVLKLMSYVEWDRSPYQALSLAQGLTFRKVRQINMRNVAFTSVYCKNPPCAPTEAKRRLCLQPQVKMSALFQ